MTFKKKKKKSNSVPINTLKICEKQCKHIKLKDNILKARVKYCFIMQYY